MPMSKIEAVIFDWAGTVVDFGSFAPTTIFIEAFKQEFDFDLSLKEARGPMGLGKWDHIKALGQDSAVEERWLNQFGQGMTDDDVDKIYEAFMPLQIAKVAAHASLIPGASDTLEWLRDLQIRVGSCSGYPRVVMDVLSLAAENNGYSPECIVATDDLPVGGRPGPWMALQNVISMGVNDVKACVKVDDSAPGIYEGHNAGMWTIGLSLSGNESGLTLEEFLSLSEESKALIRERASVNLKKANAHYIVDTIADVPAVIEEINRRLVAGERP